MSDRVYMSHPDLPGQRIHVRPAGVGVYQASGWQVDEGGDTMAALLAQVPQAEAILTRAGWTLTPPDAAQEPSAEAEPETASEPRRRRRAETEEKE